MNVRVLATAAGTAAVLALALAACTTEYPVGRAGPTTDDPTVEASPSDTPSPTAEPTAPTGEVKIRAIVAGAVLSSTADALRAQFPTWEPFEDAKIEEILNAGCDAIDASGTPVAGAEAIAAYGIDPPDAAFGLMAAIANYCPEYTEFISG